MSSRIFRKLSKLFRWNPESIDPLGLFGRRKRYWDGKWRNIGMIEHGEIRGNIPKWVIEEDRHLHERATSSSLLDKHFYLKGRHFEYRLTYLGQGGAIAVIDRRKRRG